MRIIAVLLCLAAAAANAQSAGGARPSSSEDTLTPPPITSAPHDETLPAPPVTSTPEEEFLQMPGSPSTPAAAPIIEPPPPPPPPRAAPTTQPPPPAPAPQRQPSWAPPPRATGPAEPASQRALRHSRYSAGAGGALFAVTAGFTGVITGAMLGSAFDIAQREANSDGFTGAIMGGLTLGTAATLFQYFVPIGRREALLTAGAATTGLMASLTIAHSRDLSDKETALLTVAATQGGILSVLLLTAGGQDVSAGDAGLVGASSLYGLVLTGLIEYIHSRQSDQSYNFVPLLLAPAVGMAVGGLLAIPLEISSTAVFELTTFPLGTGLLALAIGSRLADGVTVAKTVLGTMAGTFLVVALFNVLAGSPPETMQSSASTFQAMPVPVVMSAGRDNQGLAAGPGLLLRF
jgi:hypothetical protein